MKGTDTVKILLVLATVFTVAFKLFQPAFHIYSSSRDEVPARTIDDDMRLVAQLMNDTSGPRVFEQGIVSTDSLDFNAAFGPDGKFYFCRSANKITTIYSWLQGTPEALPFSKTKYSDADPAFAPNGELYFISTRPKNAADTTKDYDIWKVKPLPGGGWSEPVNVEALNSPQNEFYISFTKNGDACFSSNRNGGYGEEDIYTSKYNKGTFEQPQNLGEQVNTKYSEYDPFILPDGKRLIFASSGRPNSLGKADLYWSIMKNRSWMTAQHFDAPVNTATRDYCPYIAPHLYQFFYSSDGDVKFMPLSNLPKELR